MSSLIPAIRSFVETAQTDFEIEEREGCLICRTWVDIHGQPCRVYLGIHEDRTPPILNMHVMLPMHALKRYRVETALLINALNDDFGTGIFFMDPHDGEIMTRFRIPCADVEAKSDFISYLMGSLCSGADRAYTALLRVAVLGQSTVEAMQAKIEDKAQEEGLPAVTVQGLVGNA